MGSLRNVEACQNCPREVREELRSYTMEKKESKAVFIASQGISPSFFDECEIGDGIEE